MRGMLTSLTLICALLLNGVASFARDNKYPSQQERNESQTSSREPKARTKRESRREQIIRNPRLSSLFKGEEDDEAQRYVQPSARMEWYLQKRLPKGIPEMRPRAHPSLLRLRLPPRLV